jgi:hypothetical protein
MSVTPVLKSITINNLDFTGTDTGRFKPSDEEEAAALETMKRMTAKINTEEYMDQLEMCPEITLDHEQRELLFKSLAYDFLELRQLGPRPEDMLYLPETTSEDGESNNND